MTSFAPSGALSAAAAAFVLAGIAASATTASAAVTASHYQQTVNMVCGATCIMNFPQVAAKQTIDIDHIACDLTSATGALALVYVRLLPTNPAFIYPLEVHWQRQVIGANVYTLGGDVNIRVQASKHIEIEALIGGGPAGFCTMTGTRLTSN